MYYELTDGCELTFANVSCQYHYSLPPEGSFDAEATQAYSVDGGEAANNENKEELEAAKKGVEEEGIILSMKHKCIFSFSLLLVS